MHLRTTPEKPKATLAVRGPLSQLILDRSKFDVPEIIGDPGICLPLFYQPSAEKKYRLGIIVHGVDRAYWESQKLPEDVLLIKTDRNIEPVIDDIASCEFTISSSLHGVIESHSYGVPSVWVRPNTNRLLGDDTKFLDYFQSVNMAVDPNDTPRDITISLALSLQSYAALPDHDMTAMAEKLMSCCPFKPD
jgi:pyruvyltransferase